LVGARKVGAKATAACNEAKVTHTARLLILCTGMHTQSVSCSFFAV